MCSQHNSMERSSSSSTKRTKKNLLRSPNTVLIKHHRVVRLVVNNTHYTYIIILFLRIYYIDVLKIGVRDSFFYKYRTKHFTITILHCMEVILTYGIIIAIISFTFPLRLCALRNIEPCEYTKRTVKVSNSRGNTKRRKFVCTSILRLCW